MAEYQYEAAYDEYGDYDEEDEDMPATERELAEDAQWKLIQKNTFTRWANEHLKTVNKHLADLETDLSDGLRLLNLVEVLAGKKFAKYNRRPNFRTQKLENVTMTLRFLEEDEGIRIVNIDSSDIVDCKLKLILGLIWTLILHYSISMPMWDGDDDEPEKDVTPKQRLLAWIQNKVPDRPITNFTTNWNDGCAIGALVDAIAPGLCPDYETWNPKKAIPNAKEAMDAAEQWLDVPQLIVPAEMCNPKIDELSMMTYLSQFPNAKLKPGAPLRPKTNPNRVRAYGPGIETTGNCAGAPARFTIETFSAGRGEVEVIILNPRGQQESCEVNFNNDRNLTYSCMYVPAMEGQYRVIIKFANTEIPKSPFTVNVEGSRGDASKCSARGPGIERTGVKVTKKTYFEVLTPPEAGVGVVDVGILDPQGRKDAVKPVVHKKSEELWYVEYTAQIEGLHSINVFFAGNPIPHSPFGVAVSPEGKVLDPNSLPKEQPIAPAVRIKPSQVKIGKGADPGAPKKGAPGAKPGAKKPGAKKPGTKPGAKPGDKPGPGKGKPGQKPLDDRPGPWGAQLKPVPKGGAPKPGDKKPDDKDKPGTKLGDKPGAKPGDKPGAKPGDKPGAKPGAKPDQKLPEPKATPKPGDKPGATGDKPTAKPTDSKPKPKPVEKMPELGQAYGPKPGSKPAAKPEPKKPEPKKPEPEKMPELGQSYGPKPGSKPAAKPEPKKPEPKKPEPEKMPELGASYGPKPGSKPAAKPEPKKPTPRGGVPMQTQPKQPPRQPFQKPEPKPSPVDSSKCYASGRGIQPKGIRVGDDAVFKVHTKGAGEGSLKVQIIAPGGQELPCRIKKIDQWTYEVVYKPATPGHYVINVTFGEGHVTKSPFQVEVGPYKETKIVAFGPGLEGGVVSMPAQFTVETNGETGSLGFSIEGPSQAKIDCKDNGDGSADVTYYPTVPGEYAVHILCNEEDIPKSPYMADIVPNNGLFDPTKASAKGPGLEPTGVTVNKWAEFTVDTRMAGKAPLHIAAMDADYNPIDVVINDNRDGTYRCRYMPKRPVKHTVIISYGGVAIPKSPYRVQVQEASNPGKVKVFGPAIEKPVKTFEATYLIVDCSEAGPGDVAIALTNERGLDVPVKTTDNKDNTFRIDFEPTTVGLYNASVFFAEQEIPSSPYKINVLPSVDVSKVRVEGLQEKIPVGKEQDFDIITTGAGKGQVQVMVRTPSGRVMPAFVEETVDGFAGRFTLSEPGPHTIQVTFAGQPVPSSPFRVTGVKDEAVKPVCDPSKVKAYGPGLKGGTAQSPAEFTIDTREAGSGGLGLTIEGPCEAKIECFDKGDGTCDVRYWPVEPGEYTINILYNDTPIPNAPFKSQIQPSKRVDVSGVKVYGPGIQPTGVFLESTTEFTVDAKSVTKTGDGKVKTFVTSPNGTRMEALVNNNNDGTYKCMYTPFEQGPHKIDVTYEGLQIPKSPFPVGVVPGCDPSRVRAYGPGLEGGYTNQPQTFTVETRGAGQGGLGLAIEGPAEAKMTCRDNRDGSCTVEYFPTKSGDYDINVKFADKHIPGSPFKVRVVDEVDSSKVKVYGQGVEPAGVRRGQPAPFVVDATQAGVAPVEVITTDKTGNRRPAQVTPRGDGNFDCVYYPDVEGPMKVDVKYAGQPVPQSPFQTRVNPAFDASKVKVYGDGVKKMGVLASMPVGFTVDTKEAGLADLDIVIQDASGQFVRPKIQDNGDGTYNVQYTPEDIGLYNVEVKFGGQNVPNAPFKVQTSPTGDASKVRIADGVSTTIPVGEECIINVNTAEAGYGNITCRIHSTSGSDVDIDIVDNGDGTVSLLYTPRVPDAYTLNIKFGGQPVPNGQFTQQAGDQIVPETAAGVQSGQPSQYHPVDFCIPVGPIFNFVSAVITTPSGRRDYPKVEDNGNGTVTIRYQPTEIGLHTLEVLYNQQPVNGSPFKFHVDAITAGYVTAYGPGLSHGIAAQPAHFTIVTKDAGAGGLALAVEGPSKAEIQCVDNKDGTCSVSYLPTAPGEYNIIIKFADKHIAGGPFTAKITGPPGQDQQRAQLSVGASSEVSLKVDGADIHSLQATIRSPSGLEEPCFLKRLANGHLGISFTPREVGEHLVNVFRNGQHIPNSPFKIFVGESEIGNASKVKVYGRGLTEGMANAVNEFFVNTKDAGYGGLSLSIEGPSKADIECQDNEDGSCRVTYKPTEPGNYIVNVKFADEHVPGSPFLVKIGGEPSGRLTERITRQREAADITHVGSQCELSLKIPGTSPYDMGASVCSPSGVTEMCDIVDLADGHYSIKFVPKEMGIHTVSVKHKGMHIPGSPFQFTVGPITDGGSHKVRGIGPGLERGEVNKPCHFNIFTREAGAGGLSIAVEGPSKAEIDFQDKKDGSCEVAYVCTEPGEYLASVKFNDQHIPDSPFKVHIAPAAGDSRKLTIQSLQEMGLQVNKPAAFTVDFNGAQGRLDARVVAPSGAEDEAIIQEVDKDRYAVRFVPRENGVHYIHVRLNGNHIPGSPFKVMVGQQDADAGNVRAYGEGLARGRTGAPCKFIVNTVNAGSGALAVTVDGPSKVQLNCREVEEGYEFMYTPTAPGVYMITIKYAGNVHIPGSPFKAMIEGAGTPAAWSEQSQVVVETVTKTSTTQKFAAAQQVVKSDATKVVAQGAGLQQAYINKEAQFTVNTANAGLNMLLVGVLGPHTPCEEVHIRHVGRNQYTVSYLVKERGNYVLIVKWGDEHIPGSPYHVTVQ